MKLTRSVALTHSLALDSARNTLKNSSGGAKQEHARLEVENAEEKLVTATEEAIGLMKRVLEDVGRSHCIRRHAAADN